jgi:hypothetical protein
MRGLEGSLLTPFALTSFHVQAAFVCAFQAALLQFQPIRGMVAAFADASLAFAAIYKDSAHNAYLQLPALAQI